MNKKLLLIFSMIGLVLVVGKLGIKLRTKEIRHDIAAKPVTKTYSNKIAFVKDGEIWFSNLDGADAAKISDIGEDIYGNPVNLTASPDGRYIMFLYQAHLPLDYPPSKWNNVYLLDLQTRELRQLTHTNGYTNALAVPLTWSPDSRLVATIHMDIDKDKKSNSVAYWPEVWNMDGELVWTLKDSELSKKFTYQNYYIVGWSRDNAFIYLKNMSENVIYKINIQTSEAEKITDRREDTNMVVGRVSNDGKFSAYEQGGNILIRNLEDNKSVQLTTDGSRVGYDNKSGKNYVSGKRTYDWIQWSPDGKYISARYYSNFTAAGAMAISDGMSIITVDTKEQADIPFNEFTTYLFNSAWTSDSEHIVVSPEGQAVVFNRIDGTSRKVLDDVFWATIVP